ncbi:MAG: Rrf2 family transcriptional regulator [Actinomycetota bacterium]
MHLTKQSDYGVRAVLHLSRLQYGEVVQTKEIAASEDIPRKYLPSIIRILARAGLIRTLRGNHGGVMLARPPEDISLRDVVEAVEGPIALVTCMNGPNQCSREDDCILIPVYANLQEMMVGLLGSTTFADIISGTYVNVMNRGGTLDDDGVRRHAPSLD